MPNQILQVDENMLETKLDRLVSEKVEQLLNAMLDAEADEITGACRRSYTLECKTNAARRALEGEPLARVARDAGCTPTSVYQWMRRYRSEGILGLMDRRNAPMPAEPMPAAGDDVEELRRQVEVLRLENAVMRETIDVLKADDPRLDLSMLTNRERTRVVDAIRGEFGLAACLKAVGLKRSTYYYERGAIAAGDRYAVLRARVAGLFEQGGRAWGYRTIHRMLRLDESDPIVVSEKVVRRIMREGAMRPVYLKRPKRWSSYAARSARPRRTSWSGTSTPTRRTCCGSRTSPSSPWTGTSAGFPRWSTASTGWWSPGPCRAPRTPTWRTGCSLTRSPRSGTGNIQSSIPIKPVLLLSRGTVRGLGGWPCPMWFPGLTFRVMFVLSHLIRTKEFAMGETTVGHVAGEVVRALYGAGYMESTIGQYRKSIRALERYAGGPDAVYTRGLGAGFAASTFSERTGGFSRQRWFDYGRLARLCDSYLRSGSVDLGKWRRSRLAEPVVPGLAVVMERWEAYLAGSGLASATVGHYRRMAGLFLTWLESHGVVSLDGSDGSHVLGFLAGLRSRWSESSMRHAASDLRPLFRWLGRDDLADAIGLAGIRRTHAIAGTLPDDEHRRLLEACASRSVPSRDAAITLLSLTCGLRACDVIGLRIADVDWDSMSIGLVQRKTGNPLTVPMTGPLAARLASWLLDERPATDDDRVFVRYKAPHVALRGHSSVYEAISRVMRHAGLGRRGGSRLLRRNAATRMLEAATPLPTISAVLGHADPDSTRVYMATHRGGMLACVLPVPEGGSS